MIHRGELWREGEDHYVELAATWLPDGTPDPEEPTVGSTVGGRELSPSAARAMAAALEAAASHAEAPPRS